MFVINPMVRISMRRVVYCLKKSKAFSADNAKGAKDFGFINPKILSKAIRALIADGMIIKVGDKKNPKYYLSTVVW